MLTRCTEAELCSCIRNSWLPSRTRAGKPDTPDHTSGPPPALLRPSRSQKSPRPECASESPFGIDATRRPSTPKMPFACVEADEGIVVRSQFTFARWRGPPGFTCLSEIRVPPPASRRSVAEMIARRQSKSQSRAPSGVRSFSSRSVRALALPNDLDAIMSLGKLAATHCGIWEPHTCESRLECLGRRDLATSQSNWNCHFRSRDVQRQRRAR
jgi:hypothetical protein